MFEGRRVRRVQPGHFASGAAVAAFRFLHGLDARWVEAADPVVEGTVLEAGRSPLLPGRWLHVRTSARGVYWVRPVDVFHLDSCARCATDLRAAHYDDLAAAVELENEGIDPYAVAPLQSWCGHLVHCADCAVTERVGDVLA